MKLLNLLAGLLSIFSISLSSFSQKNDSLLYHPNSYNLDLPKEWYKPKLLKAVTDILPATIDELKNRAFYTNGKSTYWVRLIIDPPVVINSQHSESYRTKAAVYYTSSFSYTFHASLVVFDSLGNEVSALRLVAAEEIFDYRKQYNEPIRYEPVYITDTVGNMLATPIEKSSNNGNRNRYNAAILTLDMLLEICEQKVYGIRKLLKTLN